MSGYLTLQEAADRLRCSERTVRRYIKDGDLPAALIGGKYLISPDDLAALVKNPPLPKEADNGTEHD